MMPKIRRKPKAFINKAKVILRECSVILAFFLRFEDMAYILLINLLIRILFLGGLT